MKTGYDVLVVGAGHGGAQVCATLRQLKFEGSIGLVGEEADPPYERPALSKEYFSGAKAFDRLLIRPLKFWQEKGVDLLTGQRVVAVDAQARFVTLAGGDRLSYRKLVWAAGGEPRRLLCPGGDAQGIHCIRTRQDVDEIMAKLPGAKRVVVIGGGYVGLEAAAVLTKLGKAVTVVEAQNRVLARVAGEVVSRFYEAEHREHGVDVRLNAEVKRIDGKDGRVSAVCLADGEELPADMVLVGIGIVPTVQPLLVAGAQGGNGVTVDSTGATSLPDVFALGDCALHQNDFAPGQPIRLESVQNANDMAQTVASTLTGIHRPYQSVPWFWSNQYDIRLQTVGLSSGHDDCVVRGEPGERTFSVIYLKQGCVIAADCINATKDYVQARELVAGRVDVTGTEISDPQVSLKSLGASMKTAV